MATHHSALGHFASNNIAFSTIARDPELVCAEDGQRMAEALEIKCATGVRYDKGAPNGNILARTNYSFIPISVGTVSPDSPERTQPSWTLTHC